jgi:glycosyltransferase involved in cell wall biosynthesis
VLVINDGSTDGTAEIAADFDVRVISTGTTRRSLGLFSDHRLAVAERRQLDVGPQGSTEEAQFAAESR